MGEGQKAADSGVVFYIDKALGALDLARQMRERGYVFREHRDFFPDNRQPALFGAVEDRRRRLPQLIVHEGDKVLGGKEGGEVVDREVGAALAAFRLRRASNGRQERLLRLGRSR